MILGTDPSAVRRAVSDGDPLPGGRGFAGRIDGALIRDVLGRQPLFVEADAADPTVDGADPTADGAWSTDRRDIDQPVSVDGGHRVTATESVQHWSLPDPAPFGDDETAVDTVRETVDASLRTVAETAHEGTSAIAFSGGVDSALLAARLDAPLYVAGFPDSHDVEAARSAADLLDRDLTVVELTHADIERAVPEIAAATGRTNAMDIQISLPLSLTAERVAADGFDRLLVGQGADELFGGYAKVAKAPEDPRVEADTIRGARREVLGTLPDQLERDVLALRAAGVEPVAPLLDDRVVGAGLRLSGDQIVRGEDERKWALREAASAWLPDEIATRDKKAVQYGSLAARELDRLARQDGFKRRMDDHVSKYVESLLE